MKPPSETTAAGYFGGMVQQYDSLIQRGVPHYDEMTARLLDYLPARASSVLELGCGTGNLSVALASRFPDATLTFVDAAPEMLEVTRARLKQRAGGSATNFVNSRFEELALGAARFDLITSCISLHHVKDKAPLYRALYQALAPGGTLRFADQLRGGTDGNHAVNWSHWLEFCRLPRHLSAEETQSLLDHAEAHDYYTPLVDHFEMLRSAGFAGLDCVWRNWIWGIITADRPA